jgi:hypothetical protein
VVEQVAEALVGLLRGAEAGELPHRPQPAPVHVLVHAARERVLAGTPDLAGVREVGLGVQGLDRLARERGELALALARARTGLVGRHAAESR